MLLGVIADDFTGASDIANTIAKGRSGQGGLATSQFLGVPIHNAAPEVEAGVVSLKSRSIPVEQAVTQTLEAFRWLQAQGCRQFVFKYCSTFDSTRDGNIGPVAEALADALGVRGVVACPAFPTVGRTVYQGHLFVKDVLLNESGMQNHPLTPMTDSNIRRWLRQQTRSEVGLVATPIVREGEEAVRAALQSCSDRAETLVIVDAVEDDDLLTIGRACADAPLVTGGSGIAMGLASNFIEKGLAKGGHTDFEGMGGAAAILAGSCSGATRGQIDVYARNHPTVAISVDDVMVGRTTTNDIVSFVRTNLSGAPLAYSSSTPQKVTEAQARYGREAVSDKLEALFADVARKLVDAGLRKLIVAGGETSGAVAQALALGDLAIGPEVSPGVPVLFSRRKNLALALKSGNFGGADFFEHALSVLSEGLHG